METIDKIVKWYVELPSDHNDIDTLLYASDKLAAAISDLVKAYGQQKKQLEYTKVDRKAQHAQIKLTQTDVSNVKAEDIALTETMQTRKEEAQLEASTAYIKESLVAYRDVLQGMRQRIAYLKDEKKYVNATGYGN